jgi:hypothetical protein
LLVAVDLWVLTASRGIAGVIFPSLLQLPSGITELDDRKQRRLCLKKFRSRDEELSEVDTERELECGICLEVNRKVVLPDCAHTLCMRCFEDWYELYCPLVVTGLLHWRKIWRCWLIFSTK